MEIMIEVEDFHKSFGTKQVHKGISFSVRKGECLGLIGGSGAGKSVILRSLIGLEKADKGTIRIEGVDITRFTEKQLLPIRRNVAYVFQGGALFDSMTVYENLAYPLREHKSHTESEIAEIIANKLSAFGLQGHEKVYPAHLSGGMQKRVGLARSIIVNPHVVLYDEPTAGLDPYNTKRIQDMILKLKSQGATSMLVTHDMPTAFAVCDRLAIVIQGRIGLVCDTREALEGRDSPIHKFIQGDAP
jgi:phospholipid/cholesterol/gamma-HCH transport system ATP-binding protein